MKCKALIVSLKGTNLTSLEKKLFLNNFSLFVKNFFIISILFVLSSCGGGGSGNTPDIPSAQPFVWEVVTPESQGLDSAKVQAAINFAMEDGKFTQAVIIIKNGKIVGEQYRGISSSEKTLIIDDAEFEELQSMNIGRRLYYSKGNDFKW